MSRGVLCFIVAQGLISLSGCGGTDTQGKNPNPDNKAPALNDTGAVFCGGDGPPSDACDNPEYPGQDAVFGRDADISAADKTGSGALGFDWTKLDTSGNPLTIQNSDWFADGSEVEGTQWACIEDHNTQLVWEIRHSDPAHPRSKYHTYTWYQQDTGLSNGYAGIPNGGSCTETACDTESYIHWVNQQALCGYDDWRLPTVLELTSISFIPHVLPAVEESYFPDVEEPRFFTSQSHATDNQTAWYVYFSDASTSFTNKGSASQLRLVRSDHDAFSSTGNCQVTQDRYQVVGDGSEVLDTNTGLSWQRCVLGTTWNGTVCERPRDPQNNWQGTLVDAEASTLKSAGWRMPNRHELLSLVDFSCVTSPRVSPIFDSPNGLFWSNTPHHFNVGYAWAVQFESGEVLVDVTSKPGFARLVK